MPLRLAISSDRNALETLYNARHAERVAESGDEIPFQQLVDLWQAGKLTVVVNTTNAGVINGAAALLQLRPIKHQFIEVLLPAGTLNTTLRDRAQAVIKFAATRIPGFATMTFVGVLPVGSFFELRLQTLFPEYRIVDADLNRAIYHVPGSAVQARM